MAALSTALLIGAGISAAAGLGSAAIQSHAASDASQSLSDAATKGAAIQKQASDEALANSRRAQARTRSDLAPALSMSRAGLAKLGAGLGLNLTPQQPSMGYGGGMSRSGLTSGGGGMRPPRRALSPSNGMSRQAMTPTQDEETVPMVYPQTGEMARVPMSAVQHYQSLGATVLN